MDQAKDQEALFALIDGLRARGVRRYCVQQPGNAIVEIEFGAPDPPVQSIERPVHVTPEVAREQARQRNLEDEFRHVGGPPPWLAKQVVDDVIEQDPGDDG